MTEPLTTLGENWPDPASVWSLDDTERWLSAWPLPLDFRWERTVKRDGHRTIVPEQPVLPDYTIHKGYGFWLRTTPYFPGLFEEIHDILQRAPDDEPLSPEWLAAQLVERRNARGEQSALSL